MSSRIHIVADMQIPFLKGVLEPVARVTYLPGSGIRRKDLMDADALITRTRTICSRELIEGTPVKMIATATIGFDHIDTKYCEEHGIRWTNAPGCNSSSVGQYILSALLSLAAQKKIHPDGVTIGIIGVGHVGSKVARIAEILGMRALLNDPPRAREEGGDAFTSLDVIREESDIITLHVPLNMDGLDKTHGLVDNMFLNSLGNRAILINTSRGEVVDETALKAAIGRERISAAVLDVWDGEPDIDRDLLKMVKIATPHIAGYSLDGKAHGTSMSVRALSRFFHLGLDDWYPEALPTPEPDMVAIHGTGKGILQVVGEVVGQTYDILADDHRLRSGPERFEKMRAEYPVRREAPAYRVRLINDEAGAGAVLEKLGYQLLAG